MPSYARGHGLRHSADPAEDTGSYWSPMRHRGNKRSNPSACNDIGQKSLSPDGAIAITLLLGTATYDPASSSKAALSNTDSTVEPDGRSVCIGLEGLTQERSVACETGDVLSPKWVIGVKAGEIAVSR